MSRAQTRRANAQIERARRIYPDTLVEIPRAEWPLTLINMAVWAEAKPLRAWCSRMFIAVLYDDAGRERLSICVARLNDAGHYQDGLVWDELQSLKAQAGFADRWAVEVYPPAAEVVNVSNMRHLWLLPDRMGVGWSAVARAAVPTKETDR